MNNQLIREVEEDLQELRNKWIAKGETESFVNAVIGKYAKLISSSVKDEDKNNNMELEKA